MKLYIIGLVASGKSTLARKISSETGLPVYHLDDIVHDPRDNTKRSDAQINQLFQEILQEENYIIEDVGRACFAQALQEVDEIVFINLPKFILKKRILTRFIKQKLGFESSNYRPSLQMLKMMFTWLKDSPAERIRAYSKVVELKNLREVRQYLHKFER